MQHHHVFALAGTFLAASHAFADVTVGQMGIGFGFASLANSAFEVEDLDQVNPPVGSMLFSSGTLGGAGFTTGGAESGIGTYASRLTYTSGSASSVTMTYDTSLNVNPYGSQVLDLSNRDYCGSFGTLQVTSLTAMMITLTSSSFIATGSGDAFLMLLNGDINPEDSQWDNLTVLSMTRFPGAAGSYSISLNLGPGTHLLSFGAGAPNGGGTSSTTGTITVTEVPGPSALAAVGALAITVRRRRR